MELNTIKPGAGARKARKRVGRGIGSGLGKTAGRGHKGQKSRAGGYHKVGFEGGQMPLQRRLPKRGFLATTIQKAAEVRSGDLARVEGDVTMDSLKAAGLIPPSAGRAKIILAGAAVEKKLSVSGIAASKGAREAIEKAGGKIAEIAVQEKTAKLAKKQPAAASK